MEQNIKIIHIIPAYKPAWHYGGPSQSVSALCEALAANDEDVEVLTTTANGKTELNIPTSQSIFVSGVKVRYFARFSKDPIHFSPALLWHLYKLLQKQNGHVVIHVHAWWNLVSILAVMIACFLNIPVVLSPRGMLSPYTFSTGRIFTKTLSHYFLKKLLGYCHLHVTSEQEQKEILDVIQAKSISMLPNLIQPPVPFQRVHNEGNDVFKILFLSRIDPKKGIEILFEALALVKFQYQLSIAGKGTNSYISTLKKMAAGLKIADSLVWLGEANPIDKYRLMARNQLLALPSLNENFGNVVLECLSVGTPVLVSNRVGISTYVEKHNLGWVSVLSATSIAKILSEAYTDKQKREYIAKNAPELVIQHFSSKQLITHYLHLYHRCL